MKKINIILISLILSSYSFAQKSFSVSVLGGINNYNIKGEKDYFDKTKYINYYENEKGYTFGVGSSLNMNKKSFFNLQLLYSTLSYNSHINDKYIFNDPQDSSRFPLYFNINGAYLDIPISYGLHFINKDSSNFRLYSQFGLRPSILIHSNNEIIAINGDKIESFQPLRKFTLSPFIGLGFGYMVSKDLSINLNVFYNQHIKPYDYGSNWFPNNIPILFSVKYGF